MTLKISIIGLGQIGASLGMAFAAHKNRYEVSGYDSSKDVSRKAVKLGALEKTAGSPSAAVKGADLVILALPIHELRDTLKTISRSLNPDAIVMETAPVKSGVISWIKEFLPASCIYIGLTPALNPAVLWLGCGALAVMGAIIISLEVKANRAGLVCEDIAEPSGNKAVT